MDPIIAIIPTDIFDRIFWNVLFDSNAITCANEFGRNKEKIKEREEETEEKEEIGKGRRGRGGEGRNGKIE